MLGYIEDKSALDYPYFSYNPQQGFPIYLLRGLVLPIFIGMICRRLSASLRPPPAAR